MIDYISVKNADWACTPDIYLNSGLIAVIGARGSGKTALADMIAAGCDAYEATNTRPSFLDRAREHLHGAEIHLKWKGDDDLSARSLYDPINKEPDGYPKARYLSQQFVEDLCSVEGMPSLIAEIERVIFESHTSAEQEGTSDFEELLDLRTRGIRTLRANEESAIGEISDQIAVEIDKTKQVAGLATQIAEKRRQIIRFEADRKRILPKTPNNSSNTLDKFIKSAGKVRSYLRHYSNQNLLLDQLKAEVADSRQTRAPNALRVLKEKFKPTGTKDEDWNDFLTEYVGDVDLILEEYRSNNQKNAKACKGEIPGSPVSSDGSFVDSEADLAKVSLGNLEAEIARLQSIVTQDQETKNRLTAVSQRIASESTALAKLEERHQDCLEASGRVDELIRQRDEAYLRVFDAIINEENVLGELYSPLMLRLKDIGGTLGKLSFAVNRVVDIKAWADRGEKLYDKRGGPLRGVGTLEREAKNFMAEAWTYGDSAAVGTAMKAFLQKHRAELIQDSPFQPSDAANFRPWARAFAKWLYSTDHIKLEYGALYNEVDIQKLSPGSRGIVLILLYLALDNADYRPLIIDQPEENLDPQSIYHELVPLFIETKRKRQVVMVTHNANLVVNTDADQIIIANCAASGPGTLPPISYQIGSLDEINIRSLVCDILEGGEAAFRDRARRLRIGL